MSSVISMIVRAYCVFPRRTVEKRTEVWSRCREYRPGSASFLDPIPITPAYRSEFYFFTKTTVKFAQDVDSRWLESLPMWLFHSHMYCGTHNTIKKVVGPCFSLRLDHYLEYNYIKMESWVPDPHESFNNRVSFETSFDSKQPKMEPKLVSALSETKRLFQLFRFYTKTKSFGVSIEPKQTEEQPKQCDREHILVFFQKI
jgi:hypothetical protein